MERITKGTLRVCDSGGDFIEREVELFFVDTYGRAKTRALIVSGRRPMIATRLAGSSPTRIGDGWVVEIAVEDIKPRGFAHQKFRNYLARVGFEGWTPREIGRYLRKISEGAKLVELIGLYTSPRKTAKERKAKI